MKPCLPFTIACLLTGGIVLHTAQARANCAAPRGYRTTVDHNTVTICAEGECSSVGTLLREDAKTGAVVELSNCTDGDAGSYSVCWVDECVPAGAYRYGLKHAYLCCPGCCGTYYYGMGESEPTYVTFPMGECTSTGEAPAPYDFNPPWRGKDVSICGYKNPNGAGGSTSGTGGAGDEIQADPPDDSGGCSVSSGGVNRTVLGIHALALGLLLTGRSRNRRS